MYTKKITSVFAICSALVFLGGCASEPESHLVTAPPPPPPTGTPQVIVTQPQQVVAVQPQQIVVTQPQQVVTTTTGTSYVVMQAPPAPQPEAVPPRPSDRDVWITGYWTWQNNHYAWMAGHWEMPPTGTSIWVNPRWQPEGNAFRFYEGYWN